MPKKKEFDFCIFCNKLMPMNGFACSYCKTIKPRGGEKEISYYLLKDINKMMNKKEINAFGKWICGQTCSHGRDGIHYYCHDVMRFLREIRNNIPTYFD